MFRFTVFSCICNASFLAIPFGTRAEGFRAAHRAALKKYPIRASDKAWPIAFITAVPLSVFLVIALVVSSVLMSLGMMMMSPMLVSLPFKLLLFVLVDGWALLMGSLASSFG